MDDRLRILTISDLFPNPAQPALGTFVERQVTHLQRYCENVVVVPVRVFPHLRLVRGLAHPRQNCADWQRWARELREIPTMSDSNGVRVYRPRYTSPPKQLVHAIWGFFAYPFVLPTLRRIQAQMEIDLIHAHWATPSGVVAILAQRWLQRPVVVSVHGADVIYSAQQNVAGAAIVRWVLRRAQMVLANSTSTAKRVIGCGGNPDSIRVVWLGGDLRVSMSLPTIQRDPSVTRLLTVGHLVRRKGHAEVMYAVRTLLDVGRRVEYVITGDGPEREPLTRLAQRLGIVDAVHFVGAVPHSDIWKYLRDCDIFVLPSWDEAFGVAYVEALGMGKPAIGCRGEGGPEDLRSLGECIELVGPRDVGGLTAALTRLIDDPQRRRRMGEIGRRIVTEHFTWDRTAQRTISIYGEVLEAWDAGRYWRHAFRRPVGHGTDGTSVAKLGRDVGAQPDMLMSTYEAAKGHRSLRTEFTQDQLVSTSEADGDSDA